MRQLLGEIFLDSTKVGVLQGTLLRFFFLNSKRLEFCHHFYNIQKNENDFCQRLLREVLDKLQDHATRW